jgi:hypothetical protein
VGPENIFFSPEMAWSKTSAIWVQRSQYFQSPPLPIAQVIGSPASKSLSPSSILAIYEPMIYLMQADTL